MTRVAEIADFLLGTGIGDTEAAWKAEVLETIAARWPDVSCEDLTAAYLLATVQTATQVLDAMSATLEHAAPTPSQA
ncbi:hypothetical protein MKK67_06780 [Methylobacterium sp. J-072]|uniref:hypothetical protein n=1 Tax=Methylobacterium sp. J-072 TaxID=2836651 RepID=UPI001FBB41E1|nr:hypothetical protein [Methylobacterium sp. J-072]MCJ2092201.1 hypothetical protein [Methylobacterium sp. J-072]